MVQRVSRRDAEEGLWASRHSAVTPDGCKIMTRFPAEELMVAGHRYYAVGGPLSTTRETQSNLNRASTDD